MLQVKVYDAETKQSETIELAVQLPKTGRGAADVEWGAFFPVTRESSARAGATTTLAASYLNRRPLALTLTLPVDLITRPPSEPSAGSERHSCRGPDQALAPRGWLPIPQA
jgi:hypothetical protein